VLRTAHGEYQIVVENPDGVNRGIRTIEVDGKPHPDRAIRIDDASGRHHVRVVLGGDATAAGQGEPAPPARS
jgi:hypothetical protein